MYATSADLESRFGGDELAQLTDRESGATIDDAIVTRALADADAEIDSYLATRYEVPLAPVPDVIVRLACDLARYHLHGIVAPDLVQRRYDAAVRLLRAIGSGEAGLSLGGSGGEPTASVGGVEMFGPDRVFSSTTLQDY
jgi:phage gp36-like protein